VVEIGYSVGGRSVSYAIRLTFTDVDSQTPPEERGVWMVFSGLTGQLMLVQDEEEIENLFAMLTAGRPDAP
jgi:hypothetical protein